MTNLEPIRRAIAARVFGPFREAGGLPGETSASRFDAAARAYLWNRRVRFMPAGAALAAALPVALRSHNDRRARLWYGSAGGAAGACFKHGGDVLRWIENTEAAGLRFVGWADDVGGLRHTGWHCDDEGHETLRGGVWQMPGKAGAARLLYGYAEFEGRGEMNPGSAALCVSDVVTVPMRGEFGNLDETDGARDAARWADGLAETTAEDRRDYNAAYQAGREAAEADAAAIAARAELLPLLGELRALRRAPVAGETPNACRALRRAVDSLLETISEKRAERESAWGNVWGDAAEAWRAGFMDESGFVRAVRLGYAKASDWRGPADANPCGAAV